MSKLINHLTCKRVMAEKVPLTLSNDHNKKDDLMLISAKFGNSSLETLSQVRLSLVALIQVGFYTGRSRNTSQIYPVWNKSHIMVRELNVFLAGICGRYYCHALCYNMFVDVTILSLPIELNCNKYTNLPVVLRMTINNIQLRGLSLVD